MMQPKTDYSVGKFNDHQEGLQGNFASADHVHIIRHCRRIPRGTPKKP